MIAPSVCAVMLTKDRSAMARRAVQAFRAQTYENKRLIILDSGDARPSYALSFGEAGKDFHLFALDPNIYSTVGALRNFANRAATTLGADIIAHWDDDDWSHPERIAEQVELLKTSGADCVGYREMLFWDTRRNAGEAWLYRNGDPRYVLGTSMCYWRTAWEKRPFPDRMRGEDKAWQLGVNSFGSLLDAKDPRMIAAIHSQDQGAGDYDYETVLTKSSSWKRVPAWDDYCEKEMAL